MAILELENVSKHFGAIQAVSDVSLTLEPGEVVGLMGDNGAGKSTLVKIIAGDFRPSHGSMRMEGRELVLHKPIEAQQHGIEIVHQDLALCDNLTAAANVFLGREMLRGGRSVQGSRLLGDVSPRRRDFRRTEVRDSSSRPCATDVWRPAAGRRDRAHAPVQGKDRADGRADRRDFGAASGGGAEPHPTTARQRHRDRAYQPSHARRLRRRRSHCRPAPGSESGRQADRQELARRGHRPDHRRHRECV